MSHYTTSLFFMKKGSELVGIVTKVNFPNKAIVETEEGPVKVKNALPGDKVKVEMSPYDLTKGRIVFRYK